ncbi:MAG: hypothetical protein WC916_00290 [Candidatus Woesearchaeota archaeon]
MQENLFNQFQNLLGNAGRCIDQRLSYGLNSFVNVKIFRLNGMPIIPTTPVQETKMTLTWVCPSSGGRIVGVDNHENKPLHVHVSGTQLFLAGSQNVASAGSYVFLHLL